MPINHALKEYLNTTLKTSSIEYSRLTGGDINNVYSISTGSNTYVLKVNSAHSYPNMFECEAVGLRTLAGCHSIRVPKVIGFGTKNDDVYLLLEYIAPGTKKESFWADFGVQLAQMHQHTQYYFGFETDNYIGSLPQYNNKHETASDFYIAERLEPQLRMAQESGYAFTDLSSFYKNMESEIPEEPSALIHGDLWSGNYLVDEKGNPCLIDPAVCYAPREMDIAMMHLFGGFDSSLFHVYHEIFPLQQGWKNRLDLWQLYYLLVHLNIFGSSYLARVKHIFKKYS